MKMVFICSPFRGKDWENNRHIAETICRIVATQKRFIPIAPHAYFTRFLDDNDPAQRELGLEMGKILLQYCDEMWVFLWAGLRAGMKEEIKAARADYIPVRYFTSFQEFRDFILGE